MCALLAAIVRKALRGARAVIQAQATVAGASLLSASWFEPDRGPVPPGAA